MTKKKKNNVRLNLILPGNAKAHLDEKSNSLDISVQDLIRSYIRRGIAIDTIIEDGATIYAELESGERVMLSAPSNPVLFPF